MITVFGEGRGFRVVWLLEEMGLAYRLRDVDLQAGVENDAEFLTVNPAGFIPPIQDGDVTMVESIAIMEYLIARYGPTPLAPAPHDPSFPAYQQFLHLGEAGFAASIYFVSGARHLAPEGERQTGALAKRCGVREPADVGDAAACAFALPCERHVHRSRHLSRLCSGTGHEERGRHAGRDRGGLHGPHPRTRSLPADPRKMSCHAKLVGQCGVQPMTAPGGRKDNQQQRASPRISARRLNDLETGHSFIDDGASMAVSHWDKAAGLEFRAERQVLPRADIQRLPDRPRTAAATGRLLTGRFWARSGG